ncbi:hypothetical protein FRC02_000840 [Tulasnella sp. 418]|nr:hypothetical protein FRC02_000840 [Tulasnella sp. 418]
MSWKSLTDMRRYWKKGALQDSGGEPKLVIAHFMVGNTYPYGFQDWITDIRAASDNSIDGFALNVGRDSWNGDRVRDAYAAAQAIGPMFKLLLSFDVTAMSCGSYDDANFIRQYIANYANHPNQLKDSRGRIIVSTFGGEYCTFGQGNLNDGWRKAVKEGLPETLFIPSFFSDPSNFKDYNVVDGMFYWNGGWPLGNYDINFDRDNQQINGLRQSPNGYNKVYMAAVSPWFFTHYGPDTFNKNWIFKGDNHLYNTRWDLLIAHRNEIGIAEIISWNDYGESHYIGRPHSKYASAPDHVDRPNNWDWTEDYLWATLFATAPGSLTIASGPNSGQFNVPYSGVHKFKVPSGLGRMSATMYRNGIAVWNFNPDGFQYTDRPPNYNFNAFVAAGP